MLPRTKIIIKRFVARAIRVMVTNQAPKKNPSEGQSLDATKRKTSAQKNGNRLVGRESLASLLPLLQDAKNVTGSRSERMRHYYSQALTNYQPLPSMTQSREDPDLTAFMRIYHDDCAGKEHMLRQLKAANITLTPTIANLEGGNQVVRLRSRRIGLGNLFRLSRSSAK